MTRGGVSVLQEDEKSEKAAILHERRHFVLEVAHRGSSAIELTVVPENNKPTLICK